LQPGCAVEAEGCCGEGEVAAVVTGCQVPRIRVVPEGDDHPLWDEVPEFVAATGTWLDEWQMDVLRTSLLRRGGRWAAFAVAVCAPRQNGKNGILEMRELVGPLLLGEKLIVHTAHLADTSKEGFRRLDELIDANAWLSAKVRHIWRTNGHESIEFVNGARIRFRTRTRGGGRGFSGSPVIFDEPMFLPEVSMGSILPVISAQPDPQVWYTGSAVDQTLHEDGTVFSRVRDRAIRGEDPSLAYFEWSLEADSPDQVDELDAADHEVWARTNPALGIRITPEYILSERRELDARTFAVERLGVGDWPDPDALAGGVISFEDWKALADERSQPRDPVCFAVDAPPDRSRASIAVAGFRSDDLAHVEIVESRGGTGWVVQRAVELCRAHGPLAFIVDVRGPAASLLHELKEADVPVGVVGGTEYANACGLIYDLIDQERIRHLGTPELNSAVRVARKRDLGDAWAWSRKRSSTDISPLVAATLALWGVSSRAQTVYSGRGLVTV
jgi:hypothetical protein